MSRLTNHRPLTEALLLQYITPIDDADSCWLWHGPTSNVGYGVLIVERRAMTAFQASARLWRPDIFAEVPAERRHKVRITHVPYCPNPRSCCRPDHLRRLISITDTKAAKTAKIKENTHAAP